MMSQNVSRGYCPSHGGRPTPLRVCHFCELPIPADEKAVEARTRNGWAHFECWYDGAPFKRDPNTGREIAHAARSLTFVTWEEVIRTVVTAAGQAGVFEIRWPEEEASNG